MKIRKRIPATGLLTLLAVSATLDSQGAFNAFLRFTNPMGGAVPCPGESSDAQFPGADGWIGINSFDNGILNSVTIGSATGGASAGRATFRNFNFTKHTGAASPALFRSS